MMRRVFWTVGVALAGFWFGWFGQGYPFNFVVLATFTIWGGRIGYGFGSIFDQRRPGRRLIVYWAATLGLIGLFFGPLLPIASFIVGQILGGVIGALAGVLIGTVQLKLARRELQAPDAHASG